MDPFVTIIVGGVGLLFVGVVLLGLWYPGSGTEQLDWTSPREHADREQSLDSEDVAQMLEAMNARRRARGERELTLHELTAGEGSLDD